MKTVLIEAFVTGKAGSDAGTAEMWIEAASKLLLVGKVIVITATADRVSLGEKEEIIVVPEASLGDKFIQALLRMLPGWVSFKLVHWSYNYLGYLRWLNRAQEAALSVASKRKIDLALHVTYSSLIFGTRLGALREYGIPVVTGGTWPGKIPHKYMSSLPLTDRVFMWLEPMFLWLTAGNRDVDIIACANLGAVRRMQAIHKSAQAILVREPSPRLAPVVKKRQVLFVDNPGMPRKGRDILLQYLKRVGAPPIKLRIVSPKFDDFSCFQNVEATDWLAEDDFYGELSKSQFVLSTSLREGFGTTFSSGASAGCVLILTPIVAFEDVPDDACIKLSAALSPVAALAEALNKAATMSSSDIETMAIKSQAWADDITDPDRLQKLLLSWLEGRP